MIELLSGLLFTIDVICALLLIGIILIQQSKSGGGLGAISGGMGESVFGASVGNVITKTTVVLASVFLVSTLILAFISKYEPQTESVSDKLKQKEENAAGNENPAAIPSQDIPAMKDSADDVEESSATETTAQDSNNAAGATADSEREADEGAKMK